MHYPFLYTNSCNEMVFHVSGIKRIVLVAEGEAHTQAKCTTSYNLVVALLIGRPSLPKANERVFDN